MAGIKLDDDESGNRIPSSVASEIKMKPDVPKAKRLLGRFGAIDLSEMLFGDLGKGDDGDQ